MTALNDIMIILDMIFDRLPKYSMWKNVVKTATINDLTESDAQKILNDIDHIRKK
jgi:hypothetical protein